MALELSLSFLEQNDNTALQITDDSGTYHAVDNPTGWGAPNEAVTDIVESTNETVGKYHLLLGVTYTGSNAVPIVYTDLNLYDLNGGAFADVTELTWSVDPADLVSGGIAQGSSEDTLLDGKYDFVYSLVDADDHSSVAATLSISILLDGKVRVKVYNKLREIPTIYNTTDQVVPIYNDSFREILTTLLKKALFDAMLAGVTHSNTDDVLDILDTLERLTLND